MVDANSPALSRPPMKWPHAATRAVTSSAVGARPKSGSTFTEHASPNTAALCNAGGLSKGVGVDPREAAGSWDNMKQTSLRARHATLGVYKFDSIMCSLGFGVTADGSVSATYLLCACSSYGGEVAVTQQQGLHDGAGPGPPPLDGSMTCIINHIIAASSALSSVTLGLAVVPPQARLGSESAT